MTAEHHVRGWRVTAGTVRAVLLILLGTAVVRAETVQTAVQGDGIAMTEAECAAIPQAVWVTAMGRSVCMRYYLSTVGGEGQRPVVFLQGDWPGPPRDETTDDLFRFAARISTITNTPAIYLARVGRDGSSGTHALRHRKVELMITNAALDAIRERYHFEGFHVYGHSGGATLTGGLLGLRTDIACAVPADGPLDTPVRRNADPAFEIYSVAAEIPAIARNNAARILVVTDPQDLVVRIGWQLPFVEKLRRAGGKVEIFYVDAGGDEHAEHHFTTPHADLVMRDCIHGAGYEEIAADLAEFVARRLRTAVERAKAQAAAARPATQEAPQSAQALADDADTTCKKASGDDSIAACARLLTQNPKDAGVYYSRGYSYEWSKGDHDHAIADFSQAIALNPKYALAYQDRGFSYEHKGDWDQAFADFNQAILFDPNLFGAYNGRGNVYWHRGEIDRAIADYSQAILVNPKFASAYRNRGFAYSAKGEHDLAIADYDQALRLNPDFAEARENASARRPPSRSAGTDPAMVLPDDPKWSRLR